MEPTRASKPIDPSITGHKLAVAISQPAGCTVSTVSNATPSSHQQRLPRHGLHGCTCVHSPVVGTLRVHTPALARPHLSTPPQLGPRRFGGSPPSSGVPPNTLRLLIHLHAKVLASIDSIQIQPSYNLGIFLTPTTRVSQSPVFFAILLSLQSHIPW